MDRHLRQEIGRPTQMASPGHPYEGTPPLPLCICEYQRLHTSKVQDLTDYVFETLQLPDN
jgi:hypothetical protein